MVAVARGYELELERNFEFPALGFVLVKKGRKEAESGVEVGAVTVTVGYSNKQIKKLEVGKTHILHKQKSSTVTPRLTAATTTHSNFGLTLIVTYMQDMAVQHIDATRRVRVV